MLTNVDDAAKRRFNIIPFTRKPPRPDRQLEEKLKAEWPGILRWMIEGCLDWQANGLVRPAIVAEATAEYFDDQDTFGQWLEECCLQERNAVRGPGEALRVLEGLRRAPGRPPREFEGFSDNLTRRGFEAGKNADRRNPVPHLPGPLAPLRPRAPQASAMTELPDRDA